MAMKRFEARVRHELQVAVIDLEGEINITRLVDFMSVFPDEEHALSHGRASLS